MTEPIAATPPGSMPVVLRIVLAVICLVPAVIGLVVIATIFGFFVSEGLRFTSSDEPWMALFLGAAAIFVLLPVIVLGIILRYARWKAAPQASLVLAAIVCIAGALVSGMLQTTVMQGDTASYALVMIFSIAGVVVGAVPPFLHWWNVRDV
jgi:hypothetical protein